MRSGPSITALVVAALAACSSREAAPPAGNPAPPVVAIELTPLERKLLRIDLALARLDPSFHSLRIEWPGDTVDRWQWPTWVTQENQAVVLDELLSAAGTLPSLPALDRAVGDYARQMTTDVQTLQQLVTRYGAVLEADPSANRPTRAEVEPLLARFAAASQRVHAAMRAARPADRFVRGSKLAMYRACTDALETLADLPSQAPDTASEKAGPRETKLVEELTQDVSRRARACLHAAIDYLDHRALAVTPIRGEGLYIADLATSIGLHLLKDAERLRERRDNYSSSRNTSQVAAFFAEQFGPVEQKP